MDSSRKLRPIEDFNLHSSSIVAYSSFLELTFGYLQLSTETDGQTEWTNQTLEQYLRCTMNYQQNDWLDLLSQAEFAYNNTTHASTGINPFLLSTVFIPGPALKFFGTP
jgi:hypothetical protein